MLHLFEGPQLLPGRLALEGQSIMHWLPLRPSAPCQRLHGTRPGSNDAQTVRYPPCQSHSWTGAEQHKRGLQQPESVGFSRSNELHIYGPVPASLMAGDCLRAASLDELVYSNCHLRPGALCSILQCFAGHFAPQFAPQEAVLPRGDGEWHPSGISKPKNPWGLNDAAESPDVVQLGSCVLAHGQQYPVALA